MHREDWNAVYTNQDRILNSLNSLKSDIFLAGGTGLHRFVEENNFWIDEVRRTKNI